MYVSSVIGSLSSAFSFFRFIHAEVLRSQITWLMGIPAGFKLNCQLSFALGSLSLCGLDFWESKLRHNTAFAFRLHVSSLQSGLAFSILLPFL